MRKSVHLEEVREINEHVITCLFLPARNVETDRDDVETLAAFRKLVFYREGVQSRCCERDNVGQT
jgi:hypothetical protein